MPRTRLAPAMAVLLSLATPAARADTAPPLTAEQSGTLAHALRLWTLGLVGDAASFTATPAEGGYDVAIPVAGPLGSSGARIEGGPITTKASLAADGRWHFDSILLPAKLQLTGPIGADGETLHITQTYADQNASAVVDPTLAGPSSGESTHIGGKLHIEGGKSPLQVTTGHSNTRIQWVPASPGHVDAGSVTKLDDIAIGTGREGDTDGATIHTATITTQSSDADPDRAARLFRQGVTFATGLATGDKDHDLTPEQRATLHGLVATMRGLGHEGRQAVTAEGIAITSGRLQFGLDRASLSQRVEAPQDRMDLRLRLELAGLHLPDLLPGALADLVPKHLVAAWFVTGTPVEDLYAMADQAIDEKHDPASLAGQAQTRLAKAPVTTGLDELAFDLGPADLAAKGQVVDSGPGALDGTGVIEATGLDALIKQASADPLLKRGAPVLIFLKGIGEQDGGKTVWNLAYHGRKFTVNGTDISAFLPGK